MQGGAAHAARTLRFRRSSPRSRLAVHRAAQGVPCAVALLRVEGYPEAHVGIELLSSGREPKGPVVAFDIEMNVPGPSKTSSFVQSVVKVQPMKVNAVHPAVAPLN